MAGVTRDDRGPALQRYLDAVGELRRSAIELAAIDEAIAASYRRSPPNARLPVTTPADHPAPTDFLLYFGGCRAEVEARCNQLIGRSRNTR